MIQFRRLKRWSSEAPVVTEQVEREPRWSLMSDGVRIVTARWSASNYAYIDTDLLPIADSHKFTHAYPLGINSIIEIPVFVSKHDDNQPGDID